MPKLFHFPWLRRLLNKGVNTDILPELMPDGTAREAINVRPGSITGNAGGAEAIKGEVVQYPVPAGQDPEGYVLIGSCTCNNQLVEFWASSLYDSDPVLYAPIVRVDGVVVAKSKNIPYVWNRPLQIAVADDFFGTSISANEDANGVVRGRGIVYPADHNSIPLYWDINQLVTFEQNGNLAYFGDAYQVGFNSVGLFNTPEFPVHTRNVDSIDVTGLLAGQYQYALRYVTPAGDKTNIGPWTPLITVPLHQDQRMESRQAHYPGVTTIGGSAGQQTPYGIEIKFRVDNVFGFQFVEIIRKAYNTADNLGNNTIVKVIPITPNQNSIETFIDPVDGIAVDDQEIITDEEINIKVMAINKPKAVEYSDRRLTYANFETFPKVAEDVEFIQRDGKTIFPITQGVCTRWYDATNNSANGATSREWESNYYYWNDGYSDPVNNTYLKSFMRGERYGIGVMFWNQFAEQSFVTPVPLDTDEATNDGYLFPNRRDRRTGRSFQYSDGYDGVDPRSRVQATVDLNGTRLDVVGPTFEAFSQGKVRKNIPSSDTSGPWGGYNFINRFSDQAFRPFGLINPQLPETDINSTNGLAQMPNVNAITSFPASGQILTSPTQSGGNIWAPRQYALGAAIEGIKNIPSSTKVISVMRTEPAKRVVAQGIACWGGKGTFKGESVGSRNTTKKLNELTLLIPDAKYGLVDEQINLLETSPNSFQLQFVSPLGFNSESYGNFTFQDILSFAGAQWDKPNNYINAGLQTTAYSGNTLEGVETQYIGYASWRNDSYIASNPWESDPNKGNRLFSINSATLQVQNGYRSWRVSVSPGVYQQPLANTDGNSTQTRQFHEPWYVVNIVLNDAKIPNDQIDKYVETGYHIKTESCIGITPSSSIGPNGEYQDFPLLNERLGDVYVNGAVIGLAELDPAAFRYVYVDSGNGLLPWLCVTDNNYAVQNDFAIIQDLSINGYHDIPGVARIYGVYSIVRPDEWSSSSQKQFTGTIRFGQWIPNLNGEALNIPPGTIAIPTSGSRIIVKYDNNEPIRFFGGDCTISESLDALFNGIASLDGNTVFRSPIEIISRNENWAPGESDGVGYFPIPHYGWGQASGYVAMNIAAGPEQIAFDTPSERRWANWRIRQWVVYWTAEQRSRIRHYAGSTDTQGPYEWPRMGYLLQWRQFGSDNYDDNVHLYSSVSVNGTSVNVNNYTQYGWGGFLLSSDINRNYLQQAPVSGFGVPFVSSGGEFTEKFYFPTGLIASLEFNQLAQDVPSLRTFLELNLKTISEENGEIKTIASALANGGRNLYAWTDNGVSRVLTNKNVLTSADGQLLGTQSISNYWGQELWISRNIGSPDQMWQMMVKGFAPVGNGYADSFFWPDRNSIYRMVGDSIIDIGREQILSYALPILRSYPRGYVPGISGIYNKKFNEAWMPLLSDDVKKLLVYNPEINAWNGIYDYSFDGYTQVGNDVFGHRGLQTFKLDQGWTINATARQASVTVPMVADIDSFKEFIRWRVVGSKPDKIQILDPVIDPVTGDFVVMSEMPNPLVAPVNPLWVKEYDGWEGWADRTLASYPPGDRKLPQKRYFYLRVIWNREEDVNATSLSGQLKPIK